jgi:hypothetical protein
VPNNVSGEFTVKLKMIVPAFEFKVIETQFTVAQ